MANSSVDHWVRCCDDLDQQIAHVMSRLGLACPHANCSLPQPANTAEHVLPWRSYYDDATLCLVQVRVPVSTPFPKCSRTVATPRFFVAHAGGVLHDCQLTARHVCGQGVIVARP